MAGYIFSISKDSWDDFCEENLKKGFFTPYAIEVAEENFTERQRKSCNKVLAAIFGDLVTMKPGDNIYFLSNRKLYGIGVAALVGDDCKYDNYLNASALLPDNQMTPSRFLTTPSTRARWVCFFTPSPHFFKLGVDMDDVLRYRPSAFKMLRAFEGLSFIKIDDEENRALKEYISLANEPNYQNITEHIYSFDNIIHETLQVEDLSNYKMDIQKALVNPENRDYVFSEMYIESALLQALATKSIADIGHWDYVTHQLIASPFKPLKYIDKIDIFAYRFSTHYPDEPKLVTKYLLIELKKEAINQASLEQTMQYVDWICDEYASGDYSKIEAYVVGSKAVRNISNIKDDICQRAFIASTHPAKPERWNDVHLVTYKIDDTISFEKIE